MTAATPFWPLAPHTRAKHAILRRYLQAWQVILTQGGFPEIAYIDGFAGPGRYAGGEDGSPIIALKSAIEIHKSRPGMPRLLFLFVEADPERARTLDKIVRSLPRPEGRIRVQVAAGQTFEEAFGAFLGFYEAKRKPPPPTFAFIDPFGWKVPFVIIQKIMSHASCEVLVTFMYEEINRFIGHPDPAQQKNFDALFGTADWRTALARREPRERSRFLHDLYERQLRRQARVRYVRSFQMKNDNDVTDYYLFHCTNNVTGLKKMKEAMWQVDRSGEFTFSDATDPDQLVLFERQPRFDVLRDRIVDRFAGRHATVAEVEGFVLAETAFRETHYKRVLKELEQGTPARVVAVQPQPRRQPGTYSDPGMVLRFT